MWFGIISLFPDMFKALTTGITKKAQDNHLITLNYWNPRDYTVDAHRTVDDAPYGGGPGMLMKMEPLECAIKAAKLNSPHSACVIYPTPQGKLLQQSDLSDLIKKKSLIFIAGRYEGIDERLITQYVDEEWSIGDYILSGGELPIMLMIDAITRLLPGALGDEKSALEDSLANGLLKYPQYTRPEIVGNSKVPEVLLSGNHLAIQRFRTKQSLGRTWERRPDLLSKKTLSSLEVSLLNEYIAETQGKAR